MVDKLETHVTSKATFKYPHLTKPDVKFNPDGEYKVTLVFKNGEAVQKAMGVQPKSKLQEMIDSAKG